MFSPGTFNKTSSKNLSGNLLCSISIFLNFSRASFVGNLLNICPLLNMDKEGLLTPKEKIHGRKKVIAEMLNKMKTNAQNGEDYSGKCFISHSASYDDARNLADLIEKEFSMLNGKVMINNVGTVIGSHTGPGTVALFFFGSERD